MNVQHVKEECVCDDNIIIHVCTVKDKRKVDNINTHDGELGACKQNLMVIAASYNLTPTMM